MNVRLRMYKYCYSNLGAIYAKGLYYSHLTGYSLRSNFGTYRVATKFWRAIRCNLVAIKAISFDLNK